MESVGNQRQEKIIEENPNIDWNKEVTWSQWVTSEHENENGGAGGAMNSNDSHDFLPIALNIKFMKLLDYTAVEQKEQCCIFARDLIDDFWWSTANKYK